jgi:hypothetical protein
LSTHSGVRATCGGLELPSHHPHPTLPTKGYIQSLRASGGSVPNFMVGLLLRSAPPPLSSSSASFPCLLVFSYNGVLQAMNQDSPDTLDSNLQHSYRSSTDMLGPMQRAYGELYLLSLPLLLTACVQKLLYFSVAGAETLSHVWCR